MNISPKSTHDTLTYDLNQFQEGQIILYEGKKAKLIHVKPMFVIKVKDRVICEALRNRITCIAADTKNFSRDGQS